MSLRASYLALFALVLLIAAQASGGLQVLTGAPVAAAPPSAAALATQIAQAKN